MDSFANADWGGWFQNQAGNFISAVTAAKYQQPYEIQKMQAQYQPAPQAINASGAGMMPMLMLMAGGVLLVMLLKD